MILPWEIRIDREGGNDEEKKYLSSLTGVAPQQWRELKGGKEALNLIIKQLKINHKLRKKQMRVGQEESISI